MGIYLNSSVCLPEILLWILSFKPFQATSHDVSFLIRLHPSSTPYLNRIPRVCLPRSIRGNGKNHARVNIPLELISAILELAATNVHDASHDIHTLLSCALVCRAWSYPAQKLLFRNVTLGRSSQSTALHSTLRSAPTFSTAINALHVSLDSKQPGMITPGQLADIVVLCPNITHLGMAVYDAHSNDDSPLFNHDVLSKLGTVTSNVTSLSLANWSSHPDLLEQLLLIWPSISSLSISGPSSSFQPSSVTVRSALDTLRLNIKPSPSIEFLQWVLVSSSGSLRSVELDRTPSSETLSYLTDTFGSSLHSLALPSCGVRDLVGSVQQCTALRNFCVDSPRTSPFPVWNFLPPTIRSLALGINKDTNLHGVLDFVRQSSCLDSLSIHLRDGAHRNPQWSTLKIACLLSNVDLHTTDQIGLFRSLNRSR